MNKVSYIFGIIILILTLQAEALAKGDNVVVKEIVGFVQIHRTIESGWTKAEENVTLTSGDKIRSFLKSSALLVFPDSSEFRLRENTSLDIKDVSENVKDKTAKRELKLNLGSLHYKVPPKKEKASEFKIHSSTSIVGITGTEGVVTSKGAGKPSENILIEGSTYNTNDQGLDGRFQTDGNIFVHDGRSPRVFSAEVDKEVRDRMAINEEYVNMVKELVATYKRKKDEGYRVDVVDIVIKQAFFFLEKRDYDLVKQMVGRAESLLEDAQKLVIPKQVNKQIADAHEEIKAKESEGYDTSAAYAMLEHIRSLVQNGYLKEVDQEMTRLQQKIGLLTQADEASTYETYYRKIQLLVIEKETRGYALGEIKSTLRQSRIFYDQGDKPKAYQILKNIEKRLALVLKNVSDRLQKNMDRLEKEIAAKKAEAYATKELELRYNEAKIFVKEEDFLRARDLVADIESQLLNLSKGVSVDWQLMVNEIKNDAAYKKSMGYDVNEIHSDIGRLEEYQAMGDLGQLEVEFTKIRTSLDSLELPAGFAANWQAFLDDKKVKEDLNYDLREVNSLNDKIEATVKKGDIKSARTFLNKARELLAALKDVEPPKLQILSTDEQNGLITIEGYASDNTKVKHVSVNHSAIELSEDGKFLFKTVLTKSLKALTVRAEDIMGNVSAPVAVGIEGQYESEAVSGKISGAEIAYSEYEMSVVGKFVAGGKVMVNDIETFCDLSGNFNVMINPRETQVGDSITVTAFDNGTALGDPVVLSVEDKWAPEVTVTRIAYNDNFVPALNTEPLEYKQQGVTVKGQVDLKQMVNIKGTVADIGGTVEALEMAGRPVEVRDNGSFNASMVIKPTDGQLSVIIKAKDQAGNESRKDMTLDVVWKIPKIVINSEQVFLSSSGAFVKDIVVKKEDNDVVVVLANAKGETITAKRLVIADVWPPELEIQDIRYEGDKVVVTGRTSSDTTVSDINKTLFKEDIQASENVSFTLTADTPAQDQEITLTATNIEGKSSEQVKLTIGPPKDLKAPKLYISSPEFDKNNIIVSGFVEDDSKIKSVTVHGISVAVSEQGSFSYALESKDFDVIEVIAIDAIGNKAKELIVLKDKEPPQIVISSWEAKDGRLVITGTVNDNIAVKEIRLNDMPIAQGKDAQLAFQYDGALTETSKDAVIVAVDIRNNESREGPREITIPTDTSVPTGENIGIKYGSPIIYATGQVNDPAGIKAVYVNGEEVKLFDNGTFHIKVSIDADPPKLEFESLSYEGGKVIVAGKASLGDFNPAKIVVESEDLSGNRGILFTQDTAPYGLSEIEVIINGIVVDIGDNGSIRYEQPIILGERTIDVEAIDPFDNGLTLNLELEGKVPFIEVDPLAYDSQNQLVNLSGRARDDNSGLNSVTVNGVRIEFNKSDGSFSYTGSFDQGSLNVVATDNIGNVTSTTKKVNPPDIWPPVFSLAVTPIPSIIGNPVTIEITSLDSNTRLPEILGGSPSVTADLDGNVIPLGVQGEGVNYIATLETTGLDPVLVTIQVEGADEAGNSSSEMEGTNVFALVEEDVISPSFTFEIAPSPIELGEESIIHVFASEDLKEPPTLAATLPSGTVSNLELASIGGGEFESSLAVAVEEGLGNVVLRLSGGEDLSGNLHDTTEEAHEVVAPVTESDLPLNIHLIEFLPNRFTITGQTASEAVVEMRVGAFAKNIIADPEGLFTFERQVLIGELEELHALGENILVRLKAHNYAGFDSPEQTFDVPLPPIPEQGGENFAIQLQPVPVGQGDTLNISVEVLNPVTEPTRGLLYLSDGARVLIDLQGQDNLNAQYNVPEDAALGLAVFEVVAGNVREGVDFEIVLSTEWMQRLNKDEFYNIHASPDPLLVGNEAVFVVETLGDIPDVPQMQILLPDGTTENIPLSGSLRRFQGRYQSRADTLPGRAELVLYPGTPEEIRRPYGIEELISEEDELDIFLSANPKPLFGGKPYDVGVSLSRDIDFIPKLILRLKDGRRIDIPLSGDVPSKAFSAQGDIPRNVVTGLARFVLLDDQGLVMKRFPANVTAPAISAAGLDIFVVPDILMPTDTATVQVNSAARLSDNGITAHVDYPDGSKKIISLAGGDTSRQGVFTVPEFITQGIISISVFDGQGRSLGTTRAQIVEEDHDGGLVKIFMNNPEFGSLDRVRLSVEAGWPLDFVPKARLDWDGGSFGIPLNGRVPGNRFRGEFVAPLEYEGGGRIEVRDDQDTVIGELALDRRAAGEGDVIITPMPPVIGGPLSIKIIAPTVIDTAPTIRLIFKGTGPIEINAYGALPGDTFIATLNQLKNPLTMIEIIHEGNVIDRIPVDHLTMRDLKFTVDTVGDLVPCELVEVNVRADGFVPFIPQVSVDFQGRFVELPLSQLSPSEFLGRLTVPCDATSDNVKVRVFDPQGQLLWQRLFSRSDVGQGLSLHVMPVGNSDIQLEWDLLRGIDAHEIRYGKTSAMDQRITNRGVNSGYYLSDLDSGEDYFFQVAALKNGREMMASDIVLATIGATTRELYVTEYIDGSNVQIVWTEYPGADKFRVSWGNASGAYTNNFETIDFIYSIPNLVIGNFYYIKVFALDGSEVIGESMEIFVHLEAFLTQGGDIYITPDPPVQGQDLQIDIHFFDDLPFIPDVVVHLQNADVPLVPNGFGRDYTAILPGASFTAPIQAIDAFDPQGQHIVGRNLSGSGGYGGAQVPIIITPDPPQIGVDLNVRVEFPEPVTFIPALFLELASETRQYAFAQIPPNRIFDITIPGNAITSSVISIWIEGPNGLFLGDRFFDGSGPGPGYHDSPFTVTPDPPLIGSAVDMELDVGEVVSLPPVLRIHFAEGTQEVNMLGSTPGQFFTYNIASLMSSIEFIDIVNPATQTIEHTWYPGDGGGPQSCDLILLSEDPPVFGQPIDVRAVFPDPQSFTPTLWVDFENGPRTYAFPQAPGLYFYEMALPIAEMNSQVLHLKILDDSGDPLCERGPFGGGEFNVTTLTVDPDPPVIGQDLDIHVEFNSPVPFTPRWRLFTISGPIEGDFSQGAGLSVYDQTIPGSQITLFPTDLEITDDYNNDLPGGELFFVDDANFTCTVDFDPFPPQPYANLTVTATYESGSFPSYVPSASMEFEGGGGYSQQFPQAAGLGVYQMTIAAANITDAISILGIGDSSTGAIDCGADFEEGLNDVDIDIDIDPPIVNTPLQITATFEHPVPFVPRLVLEYYGAPDKTFIFPGSPGQIVYQFTTIIADMGDPIKRIAIETPQGDWIPDDLLFAAPAALDYPHNLFTQTTGVSGEIKIFWDVVSGAAGYKVYYGTGSQNYNDSNSPEDIQDGSATQAVIDGLNDNTLYFLTVESYDAQNNESNNPEEVSRFPGTGSGSLVSAPAVINETASAGANIPQKNLTITNNGASAANVKFELESLMKTGGATIPPSNYTITPASSNIAASGNSVFTVDLSIPGAAGAGDYTGDIKFYDDANSNSVFNTGEAFVDVTVNITVTGGGGGALTSSPTTINKTASAGTTTSSENVNITNNTGASVKIRFETSNLQKSGGGPNIPPSGYNITPSFVVTANGANAPFNVVHLSIPGGQADGDYSGPITFYADVDDDAVKDAGEDFVDVTYNVTVGAVVDHINISADAASSQMGTPIFVTLIAEDSSNNRVTTFQTDVDILVSELQVGEIVGSWHISTNDGPQGPGDSSVAMFDGLGGFTVDSLEPGDLQIDVTSHTSTGGPLNLEFTPAAGFSVASGFAIIGPSFAPTSATVGAPFWIAVYEASGVVKTNYTGTIDLSLSGSATFVSNNMSTLSHTFAAADNGQFQVNIKNPTAQSVSFIVDENPGSLIDSVPIEFVGVTQYLVFGPNQSGSSFTETGMSMKFTLRAADGSGNLVRSYNKAATFFRETDPTNDAFLSNGSAITFVDGIAEITLNNNQAETIDFSVKEDADNSINTGTIMASFLGTDSTAPTISRIEMDTPWIIHVYFDEDVDSVTAGAEGNYTVPGANIDKVCWYGDNVTLNLDDIAGTGLGDSFTITIDGVEDTSGNAMSSVTSPTVTVPDVDFQGTAGPTNDWFEIKATKTTGLAVNDVVHVTVFHKNVCGYLTGSNNTNKNNTVGTVTMTYGGSGSSTGGPSSVDMSSGQADFDITITAGPSITISASGGGVSTTQILTLSIP